MLQLPTLLLWGQVAIVLTRLHLHMHMYMHMYIHMQTHTNIILKLVYSNLLATPLLAPPTQPHPSFFCLLGVATLTRIPFNHAPSCHTHLSFLGVSTRLPGLLALVLHKLHVPRDGETGLGLRHQLLVVLETEGDDKQFNIINTPMQTSRLISTLLILPPIISTRSN